MTAPKEFEDLDRVGWEPDEDAVIALLLGRRVDRITAAAVICYPHRTRAALVRRYNRLTEAEKDSAWKRGLYLFREGKATLELEAMCTAMSKGVDKGE